MYRPVLFFMTRFHLIGWHIRLSAAETNRASADCELDKHGGHASGVKRDTDVGEMGYGGYICYVYIPPLGLISRLRH